jgi:mycothiol synthase
MDSIEQQRFILRSPTLDDIPAAVAMLNANALDVAGTQPFTAERLRGEWEEPGFDYSADVCLAWVDNQVAGYGAFFSRAPYVRSFLLARTHPDHYGQGIGTALTRWGEARGAAKLHMAPPAARVTVGCNNFVAHKAGAELLLDLHYQHVRTFYEMKIEMASAPPEPVWPAGISVRSMVANQEEEAVFRALIESFRDHWGYVESPFEESFAAWLHHHQSNPEYDPDFFLLAFDGDQIAGLALCNPKDTDFPDMAWIDVLGVRRPWRRRGLALALLHHAFGECYRRGIYQAGLGVDASSLTGATRLYEKAGMEVFRQWDAYEKELRAGEDISTQQVAG